MEHDDEGSASARVKTEPGAASGSSSRGMLIPKTERVKAEPRSHFASRDLFPGLDAVPVRDEHRVKKRARCICMENTAISRITSMLQTIEDKTIAIAVPSVARLSEKLWDAFKYDLSIDKEAFYEKLGTMALEVEEEKAANAKGKRKRTGNAAKLKDILSIMKLVRSTQKEMGKLVSATTTRYDQLVERQVVVNNKLAQVKVAAGDDPLKTTKWPNWCFLDEVPKRKKHKQ